MSNECWLMLQHQENIINQQRTAMGKYCVPHHIDRQALKVSAS